MIIPNKVTYYREKSSLNKLGFIIGETYNVQVMHNQIFVESNKVKVLLGDFKTKTYNDNAECFKAFKESEELTVLSQGAMNVKF